MSSSTCLSAAELDDLWMQHDTKELFTRLSNFRHQWESVSGRAVRLSCKEMVEMKPRHIDHGIQTSKDWNLGKMSLAPVHLKREQAAGSEADRYR